MCFVLFAGTSKPLPLRAWQNDRPDVSVSPLTMQNVAIRAHFVSPEVCCIGSTSGCGCDFPFVNLHRGEWPIVEAEFGPEQDASERYNREALVRLLRGTKETAVELYGVWHGDFAEGPKAREEIQVQRNLDSNFRFKEQGFYRVRLDTAQHLAPGL